MICVPLGKSRRDPSDPISITGLVTELPNVSVYDSAGALAPIWITSVLANGGVKSGPSKNGQLPSSTLIGVGNTCEPDSEIDAPSNVPVAVVVPEIVVQSANCGVSADATGVLKHTTTSAITPATSTVTPRFAFTGRTVAPRGSGRLGELPLTLSLTAM